MHRDRVPQTVQQVNADMMTLSKSSTSRRQGGRAPLRSSDHNLPVSTQVKHSPSLDRHTLDTVVKVNNHDCLPGPVSNIRSERGRKYAVTSMSHHEQWHLHFLGLSTTMSTVYRSSASMFLAFESRSKQAIDFDASCLGLASPFTD